MLRAALEVGCDEPAIQTDMLSDRIADSLGLNF